MTLIDLVDIIAFAPDARIGRVMNLMEPMQASAMALLDERHLLREFVVVLDGVDLENCIREDER